MASVEHCLYAFEALSASLEKRTPMSLYQVSSAWNAYPKGLDDEDTIESPSLQANEPPSTKTTSLRLPRLNHLSASDSGSSTPSTLSTTSLSPSTNNTTPASSIASFSPIGMAPRRSSQRAEITESPLFVTWNTVSPHDPSDLSLRGCIGTFTSLPLSTALSDYALTSALQDDRFHPISLRELPSLSVSVTLLTDFEDCKHPLDWEVGVHGIKLSFYSKNRRYGACYLPDVAVEQEWEQEETVISAMRKAGWAGRREKWKEVGDLKVERYQGVKETVAYPEYKAWKQWVDAGNMGK